MKEGYQQDDYIVEAVQHAVDVWIEGSGHIGNFITTIYEESRRFCTMAGGQWRGAMLIYLIVGCGPRFLKDYGTNFKLLMYDCLTAWEDNVKSYAPCEDKLVILGDIKEIREYVSRLWGSQVQWCTSVMNEIVSKRLREKFWETVAER
jgi:hypothetical protein